MIASMDLQLGLAVSCGVDKGFDLNYSETEAISQCDVKKRSFGEAFEEKKADLPPRTLPLLVWDGDDSEEDETDSNSVIVNNNDRRNDDRCVVGWPPVNSWRKKLCQPGRQECAVNCIAVENGSVGGVRGRNSRFVKVKMEGVGIARKVDVSLHHSRQPLLQTLIAMFGKCQQSAQFYQLKYQDEEGDWQLVEDVNWGYFKRSVQRLELVRKH